MGVVETGTRRGTCVKEVDFTRLSKALGFQMATSNLSYKQLLEARLLFELGAIDVIGTHATEEELDELEEYATAIDAEEDIAVALQKDSAFHRKLMSFANNDVLSGFARLIEMFFSIEPECLKNRKLKLTESSRVAEEHLMIIQALRDKNFDLARGMMRRHLQKWDKQGF